MRPMAESVFMRQLWAVPITTLGGKSLPGITCKTGASVSGAFALMSCAKH